MKLRLWEATILVLLTSTADAFAHGGAEHPSSLLQPTTWNELSRAWEFEPGVVVPILLSALLYAVGTWRMWRTAGVGHGIRTSGVAYFAAGMFALVVALISPLHRWGNML